MSLRKTLVGAIAVVATLTVAGCGTAVDISGSESANMSKSSFVGALSQATSEQKSVHVVGTVTAQGQQITLTADGAFSHGSLEGTSGVIKVAIPGMGDLEARIVDGVVYLKGAQALFGQLGAKPWVSFDLADSDNQVGSMLGQVTDAMGPGQFLDMLKGMSKVTRIGSENVDGVATTHYTVSVDTSKLGSKLGFGSSQLGAHLPKTVSYDVWLDESSRPVRLAMATSMYGLDLHFSKWGEQVHVVAPPASQVGDVSF